MKCTHCTTSIPPTAKFCPKCGRPRPMEKSPLARDVHPSRTPMPRAGKALVALSLTGIALVAFGLTNRSPILAIVGAALLGLLTLFVVVGNHIF